MVCNNPYLLIIVEAQKKYVPLSLSLSFNSHRFSCIIFNYINLLEAWPTLLGSHMSYTTPHIHSITLFHPPICFHLPDIVPPSNHHPTQHYSAWDQSKEASGGGTPRMDTRSGRPPTYQGVGYFKRKQKNPQAHGYRCSLHPGVFQSIDFPQGTWVY